MHVKFPFKTGFLVLNFIPQLIVLSWTSSQLCTLHGGDLLIPLTLDLTGIKVNLTQWEKMVGYISLRRAPLGSGSSLENKEKVKSNVT